jgi:hypothetical protein
MEVTKLTYPDIHVIELIIQIINNMHSWQVSITIRNKIGSVQKSKKKIYFQRLPKYPNLHLLRSLDEKKMLLANVP